MQHPQDMVSFSRLTTPYSSSSSSSSDYFFAPSMEKLYVFISPAKTQAMEKDPVTENMALMTEDGDGEIGISTKLATPHGLKLCTTKPTFDDYHPTTQNYQSFNVIAKSGMKNQYDGEMVSTELKLLCGEWTRNNENGKLIGDIDESEFSTRPQKRKEPTSDDDFWVRTTQLAVGETSFAGSRKGMKNQDEGEKVSIQLKLQCGKLIADIDKSEFSAHCQKGKEPASDDYWVTTKQLPAVGETSSAGSRKGMENHFIGFIDKSFEFSTHPKKPYSRWKIIKRLTKCDTDASSYRLLVRKESVETYIIPMLDEVRRRHIETDAGTRIAIWDFDTETEHELTFRRWPYTGSFVLINNWTREFVSRRNLKQGDTIGLFYDQYSSRLNFSVLASGSF